MMDLPRYFLLGARPIKLEETDDGGMDCLAWNWERDQFERDMSLVRRVLNPGPREVDELNEQEFREACECVKKE